MLYDKVNIIYIVIIIPNPYPFTAKFVFIGVKNNKDQQNHMLKDK